MYLNDDAIEIFNFIHQTFIFENFDDLKRVIKPLTLLSNIPKLDKYSNMLGDMNRKQDTYYDF